MYIPHACVHGFVSGRSIIANAAIHVDKKYVLNIDLEDFFPSIHLGRVVGTLRTRPYNIPKDAAVVIGQLTTMLIGELPQGAPTSPIISNLVCRPLDGAMVALARKYRCTYTRYADDITISTTARGFPGDLAVIEHHKLLLGPVLCNTINGAGFKINEAKVRMRLPWQRQEVTGLTVNEFPNVTRSFIRSLRGALHAWSKYGYGRAEDTYLRKFQPEKHSGIKLRNVIRGRIEFLRKVRGDQDPLHRKFHDWLYRIDASAISPPLTPSDLEPTALHGVRLAMPRWELWVEKYQNSVFMLEGRTATGDVASGSAFAYGTYVVTAGHNLALRSVGVYTPNGALVMARESHKKNVVGGEDFGIMIMPKGWLDSIRPLQTQCRVPRVGEQVAALGYPSLALREPVLVAHIGTVEAVCRNYQSGVRFLQISFESGGGLSGAPVIDRRGYVVGIVIENIFREQQDRVPTRLFGQATMIGYVAQYLNSRWSRR